MKKSLDLLSVQTQGSQDCQRLWEEAESKTWEPLMSTPAQSRISHLKQAGQGQRSEIPLPSPFCSLQAFNGLMMSTHSREATPSDSSGNTRRHIQKYLMWAPLGPVTLTISYTRSTSSINTSYGEPWTGRNPSSSNSVRIMGLSLLRIMRKQTHAVWWSVEEMDASIITVRPSLTPTATHSDEDSSGAWSHPVHEPITSTSA